MHLVLNNVPLKRLSIKMFRTESFLVELNVSKKKSLLSCFCSSSNWIIESRLDPVFKSSQVYTSIYNTATFRARSQ